MTDLVWHSARFSMMMSTTLICHMLSNPSEFATPSNMLALLRISQEIVVTSFVDSATLQLNALLFLLWVWYIVYCHIIYLWLSQLYQPVISASCIILLYHSVVSFCTYENFSICVFSLSMSKQLLVS
jgi:hypothetical protein